MLEKLLKLRAYLDAAISAIQAAEAPPLDPQLPVEFTAYKTSIRNRILAGFGEKAELLGTLTTEPVADAKSLVTAGLDEKTADEILTACAEARSVALALDAELSKPVATEESKL